MRFYDDAGSLFIKVLSSTSASRIGDYHNAMDEYSRTGEISKLVPFKGKWVLDARGKRRYFLTDPTVIRRLTRANVFQFESIY
ncbi:MAG TPA: hypothetical protein VKT83_13750 [bacterium]|nr:hypothetical protein [bacterium]